ncbi:MAG TPA: hypothetical protein VKS44_07595 [Candidatus Acidoferrales bacterium]|nr:hypothetical protein [Candidatus Acidoferrales bacterium]
MKNRLTRRDLLKSGLVAGASSLVLSGTDIDAEGTETPPGANAPLAQSPAIPPDGTILPLTSTSDVYIPPRGESLFKFSFDFPEPSVSFDGMLFSFRLYTFENAYGLDRGHLTVEKAADGMTLHCSQFVWAGGQEHVPGTLTARLRKSGDFVEWDVSAEMDQPIKSITAIVRGVPRGKISPGSEGFFDPKDNELLIGYPFGGGDHHGAISVDSPVAVIQADDQEFFLLSVLLDNVRANRIYLQPGANGYRVELVYEQGGWEKSNRVQSPTWRAGRTRTAEDAYQQHFSRVAQAFSIPSWEQRQDVPPWFRDIALVLSIHGMHWTGYIFNDFAKALRTLEWARTQIAANRVLVFLPAWDGRYYWEYPVYKVSSRLGGDDGFRTLIQKGHQMGFRFLPMFGMNSANDKLADFSRFSDATTQDVDGNDFDLDWVDWDNDRHNEGWGKYMNLGIDSWRNWLSDRISELIERFDADGYFLDISGGWQNNTKADMHEGTRRLVADIRQKFPHVLPVGEFSYDALLSILPVYHVFPSRGYPPAFQKYCRAFYHLSHPAPGRGSSGVHESGFGRFSPEVRKGQLSIPTITVVDDTFDKYRNVMAEVIAGAKAWAGIS